MLGTIHHNISPLQLKQKPQAKLLILDTNLHTKLSIIDNFVTPGKNVPHECLYVFMLNKRLSILCEHSNFTYNTGDV